MFQLFSWRLCLCLRLWNCFCICIWVPLPFLKSQDDFDSDCGLMGPLMINMTFIYVRNETNVRNERCHACDTRTDGQWMESRAVFCLSAIHNNNTDRKYWSGCKGQRVENDRRPDIYQFFLCFFEREFYTCFTVVMSKSKTTKKTGPYLWNICLCAFSHS